MSKNRRITLIAVVLILIVVLAVAVTACKKKVDPADTSPKDVELTEDQVKEYFQTLKIDVASYPQVITDSYGVRTETTFSSSDGMFYEYQMVNDRTVTEEFYGKKDGGYVKLTHNNQSGSVVYDYVNLTEEEYEQARKETSDELDNFLTEGAEQFLALYKEYERLYPDSAYIRYSGTKRADGSIEVKIEFSGVLQASAGMDMVFSVGTDTEERITSVNISGKLSDRFVPDAISAPDGLENNVSVAYGIDFMLPGTTGENNNVQDHCIVVPSYGVEFPEGFDASCTPGGTLTLPDESVSEVFDSSDFAGWYYDSEFKYPVEDNVLQVSYSKSVIYVYPRFDLQRPALNLNGGTLSGYYEEKAQSAQLLSDYLYAYPEKAGYHFDGWYFDESLTQQLDYSNGNVPISGDVQLYAGYTKYTMLKFVTGADYEILPYEDSAGSSLSVPPVYKKGYRFVGWYTDSALTVPFDGKIPAADATIYAKFEEGVTVNLVFYDDFVYTTSAPRYYVFEKNGSMSDLESVLRAIAKEGYSAPDGKLFTAWVTADGEEIASYPVSEITLYAKYAEPAYLTYSMPDGSYAITYPDPMQRVRLYDYAGYTFGEWLEASRLQENLLANCGDPDFYYENNFEYWCTDSACMQKADLTKWPDSNMTLYAKTSPKGMIFFVYDDTVQYTFIFDKEIPDFDSVYAYMDYNGILPGGNAMQSLPDGKVFEGWYTDEELTQKYEIPTEDGDFPDGQLTLYAKIVDEA